MVTATEVEEIIHKTEMDFAAYIEDEIRNGFLDEKTLEPIKCPHCNGTSLVYRSHHYESYYVVEYEKWCVPCEKKIGNWSYGHWEI